MNTINNNKITSARFTSTTHTKLSHQILMIFPHIYVCMNTINNNKITSILLVAATVTKPIGVSLPPLRSDLGTTKETLAPADAPVCCLQISS